MNVLDAYIEFLNLVNGKPQRFVRGGTSQLGCLAYFGLSSITSETKTAWRDRILQGGPFSPGDNTTAHPLGGCRMAATAADGVVNHRGEVFDATPGRDGRAVQPGRYIADASIIPTALGNNPLLTITALAERVADLMLRDPRNATLFQAPASGRS